ncbi:Holliday junction branch migration protein RuvA [Thermovibrio sp.]
MVEFITGKVVERGEEFVVLRSSGFGFKVFTPHPEELSGEVLLFTELLLPPEGTPLLYGFKTKEERELFKLLQKVPKVGAKVALSMLSKFNPEELKEIILSGDYERLTSVPGLGKKLSQRIVLELRGKLKEEKGIPEELYRVLKALGYKKGEVKEALKGINLEGLSLEEAVKEAVKRLSGAKLDRET